MKQKVSTETQSESMRIASGTKKPGQLKEQTKIIASGIEKGIAEYKKQQKAKSRKFDKQKKQLLKANSVSENEVETEVVTETSKNSQTLPWALLLISWAGFVAYLFSIGII
jgi:hypothetical protein